jgi:hypothetical protein
MDHTNYGMMKTMDHIGHKMSMNTTMDHSGHNMSMNTTMDHSGHHGMHGHMDHNMMVNFCQIVHKNK